MDKKIAGMIAAVGAMAPMAAAQAAVTPEEVSRAMNASSFGELLESVPNASNILKAADELRATTTSDPVQLAQFHHHHHHWWHHHHHHHWWYHHHHHHHHHWWRYHHHHHYW